MKSLITIPCSCGKQISLEITGSQLPEYAHCSNCQASIYLCAPLGNIVTVLMMQRANRELANDDITITILLSAMAVEGEMSYLFFKWKGIDSGKYLHSRTQEDKDQWEGEWADMRSIGKRLDELCRLLTNMDFDTFALQNKALLIPALDGFDPATSVKVKNLFQEQFFEKRNRIAHNGDIDFEKSDGNQCFSSALALINLLSAMDKERIKKMDAAHKKALDSIPGNDC